MIERKPDIQICGKSDMEQKLLDVRLLVCYGTKSRPGRLSLLLVIKAAFILPV